MTSVSSSTNDGSLSRYYTKALSDAENEKQAEVKRIRERAERELEHVEKSNQAVRAKYESESEESLKNIRTDAQEAISREQDRAREAQERFKEQLYNQKGQFEGERTVQKKELESYLEELDNKRKADSRNTASREGELLERLDEVTHENDKKFGAFKQGQLEASAEWADRNRGSLEEIRKESELQTRRNISANQDRDETSRHELRQVSQSYQNQLDSVGKKLSERDQYYAKLNDQALTDKESTLTDIFRKENAEHRQAVKDLEANFNKNTSSLEKNAKEERAQAENIHSVELKEAIKDKELGLRQQAKSNQQSMSDQRTSMLDTISELENALKKDRSDTTTTVVSPAAEEAMKRTFIKEYDATLENERNKYSQATGDIYEKGRSELIQAQESYQDQLSKANKEFARAQTSDRSEYFNTILESESENNSRLYEKEVQNARELEILNRHYSRLLEKQKREYESIFDTSRTASHNRLVEVKQDAELALRLAHKDATAKANAMSKEFEKKLNDQKDSYEAKIDDIKAEDSVELKATEAKLRQELEAQSKLYESKIAQAQIQSKERERVISQNFQDELDRTRRAYELVIQKKS